MYAVIYCFTQMHFARTRAKKSLLQLCVHFKRAHVRNQTMQRLSRILSEITVILRCPISWILVISACLVGTHCLPLDHLKLQDDLWKNPCTVENFKSSNESKTTLSPAERADHLIRINESITRTLLELTQITDNQENTDWNSAQNQDIYKFLKPFKKNQTTWERHVQIYLASVEVIYKMQVKIERSTNSDHNQSDKLKELRGQTKALLCGIHDFRNKTKNRKENHTGISAKQMSEKINFNMTEDLITMDLHKHFLKCRFQCFLEDMQRHVNSLIEKLKKGRPTRKVRTTKKPRKKPKKGHNKRNELKNKCCIVNNTPTSSTTPRSTLSEVRKANNNKKKLSASQQSKLIKQNQKKVQRKGNKKLVQ
nr:uncharacterized protein LOC109405556 [Aedes albopictus]